jgi:hypothetical protein
MKAFIYRRPIHGIDWGGYFGTLLAGLIPLQILKHQPWVA